MKHFTLALAFCMTLPAFSQLVDGGFEGGVDNSGWQQFSTNFGTPLCDAGCGTCGGPCAPQAGTWYLWLGGAGSTQEYGYVSQLATIPNGTAATLSFYAAVVTAGDGSSDDVAHVRVDGTNVFSISAADTADYGTYTMVSVNVSSYTDGAQHWIEIYGDQNGGSNILFDTFVLTVDGVISTGFGELMNREVASTLYPNPANDRVNLQFNHSVSGMATVRVFNMNGELVSMELLPEINNANYSLNVSNMANGLYNVEVDNGGEIMRHRFVVSH